MRKELTIELSRCESLKKPKAWSAEAFGEGGYTVVPPEKEELTYEQKCRRYMSSLALRPYGGSFYEKDGHCRFCRARLLGHMRVCSACLTKEPVEYVEWFLRQQENLARANRFINGDLAQFYRYNDKPALANALISNASTPYNHGKHTPVGGCLWCGAGIRQGLPKTCALSAVAIRPRNSSLGLEPKRPSRIVFGSPCAISDSRRELTEMETATLEVKNVDEMLFVENLDMLLRSEERCG